MKKQTKAIDLVKKWMKTNCIKGEMLEVYSGPRILVITKRSQDFMFEYKMPKKKK